MPLPIESDARPITEPVPVERRRLTGFDVGVLNVPSVLAQVQRDVVGTSLLGGERRLDRTRIAHASRLTQCRHVIDVDAKIDTKTHEFFVS